MRARRIIYVPGMKPKPPEAIYARELCRALSAGIMRVRPSVAREFAADESCLTVVPWTFSVYHAHGDIELDRPGIESLLRDPEPSPEDVAEIDSITRKLTRVVRVLGDAASWFGRLIAKPEMRMTMADARRYLNNRGGIADRIRSMVKEPLKKAWREGERILLIGHSLGSVIAYDSLWELSHRERHSGIVELFITLGSPMGGRFVKGRLLGAASGGRDRYPSNIRRWENFAARGEMTALHPELRPSFAEMLELGLLESMTDHVDLYNHFRGHLGLNVHKSYGYLASTAVATCIAEWWNA